MRSAAAAWETAPSPAARKSPAPSTSPPGSVDRRCRRHGGSNYIQKAGDNDWTHTYSGVPSAGWGLQNGTTSYAGGDGIQLSNGSAAGGFGGGGASVILDSNGDPLIVAGGGGGMSTDSPLTYGFAVSAGPLRPRLR